MAITLNEPLCRQVAVMQPYYFPYAGYFRLLAQADVFVVFDCVQFPRRGRVHRTEVSGADGEPAWLTLPLARQPRDTLIRELAFAPGARASLDHRLRALPWLRSAKGEAADRIREHLHAPLDGVVDHLEQGLRLVAGLLGLSCALTRSSHLAVDPRLTGQERVLAVARALDADRYLNSPGGVGLYDAATFSRHGVELSCLPPYQGPHVRMLEALMTRPLEAIREDVLTASGSLAR